MNEEKTKEIIDFLEQLKQTPEGKEIMNNVSGFQEQALVVPKTQETQQPVQIVERPQYKRLEQYQQPIQVQEPPKKKGKKEKETWWSKRFNKNKLKKGSKVAIIYLRSNGNVDLLQKEVKNGFFTVNNETYHEDKDCIYTLTKDRLPVMIQREWDLVPLGTKKWEDDDMREKFRSLETHVLKGIRSAELVRTGGEKDSGTITVKQAILYGILGVVLVALFLNFV